mgnify:CR=1 FL=1
MRSPSPAGGRCNCFKKNIPPSCGGGLAALSQGGGAQPAHLQHVNAKLTTSREETCISSARMNSINDPAGFIRIIVVQIVN